MASSTNALAPTASVTYNADGTAATSTDPGNGTNDTNYGYSWKQLAFVNPVTGSTLGGRSLAYDGYGRLQNYTDGKNVVTTYSYDLDDRLTGISFSGGTAATTTYSYDGAGNRTARTDTTGTTTYGFDLLNRLTARAATSGGGSIGYGYDRAGNQTSVSDARGTSTATFDAANKQTSLTTAKGTVVRYAYDSSARRTDSWFKSNADHSVWEAHSHTDYDAAGRPARVWTATNSNDATGRTFDVGYCHSPFAKPGNPCNSSTYDTGMLQWAYDHLSLVRTDYTYDAGNRLTKVQVGTTKTYTYGYDARGNRTSATATGAASQTRTFNAANQITTAGYNHDAAGDLTADPTAGTLAYNGAGQMTSVTNGSTTRTYTYAGVTQDELTSQTTGGGTVSYVYGSTDQYGRPLLTSLKRSTDATGTFLDHDVTGTPTVLTTTTGVEVFYALDGLGSPVALIRDDGTKVGAYSYDPYGTYTTTVATGDAAGVNPYRYAVGGIYDRNTGWIKYGERWYDPTTGRFTQQDSIERLGDLSQGNRYAYAADNPIVNFDPTGRDCFSSTLFFIGGGLLFVGAVFTAPATFGGTLLIAGAALTFLAADYSVAKDCY